MSSDAVLHELSTEALETREYFWNIANNRLKLEMNPEKESDGSNNDSIPIAVEKLPTDKAITIIHASINSIRSSSLKPFFQSKIQCIARIVR